MSLEPAWRAPEAKNAWDRPVGAPKKPHRPSFGEEVPERPKRSIWSALLIAILCSLVVHLSVVGGISIWNYYHQPPPRPDDQSIEMVDVSKDPALKLKLDKIRSLVKLDEAKLSTREDLHPKGQLVQLPHPATEEEAPKDAKFLAEDNHKVDKESVSKDVAVAPKVLADTFKGLGENPKEGQGKTEGEENAKGEYLGHDAKTEHATKGKTNAEPDATPAPSTAEVADPFGIRIRKHEEDAAAADAGPRGTGADHDADTSMAGKGTNLAMAGAPNNDYLPNINKGEATALNAKKFIFASFWNRFFNQVQPLWVKHVREANPGQMQHRDYMTVVNVLLNPDGSLYSIDVAHSSGIQAWDRAVVSAFNECGPFLNPPRELVEGDGKIHMDSLGFVVQVGGSGGVHMYGDPRANNLFPGVQGH